MKYEKWLSCFAAAGLAFGLAMAGAGCLVTAFDLQPVNLVAVTAILAAWAALCAVCFVVRRGALVLAAGVALLLGFQLRQGQVTLQIEALLFKISSFYHSAYGVGPVSWSGEHLSLVPVTGALVFVGGIVVLLTTWAVCRKKPVFPAVGFGFLPLAACFVVTDTIPDALYVWLMAVSLLMLLLPQSVRRKDPKAGLRLMAILLIPVLLASMLLFWCNPRETYWDRAEKTRNKLMGWMSELPFVEVSPEGEVSIQEGGSGPKEDLRKIGPKTLRQTPIMDVVAPRSEWMYLRGQSLDVYSGIGWDASLVSTGKDMFFPSENMQSVGTVSVSTRISHVRQYTPYYIDSYKLTEGAIQNEWKSEEYHYPMMELLPGGNLPGYLTVDPNRPILHQCLELPDSTREAAEAILTEALADKPMPWDRNSDNYLAELIRDYVSGSAAYSLDTPVMPAEETDFAIWFLRKSNTGYCVHFATALTVLLRAAGIPARYVTGYAFKANGGTKTVVRTADAHAWVEYLDPENGWTVLDATPAQWTDQGDTETTEPIQTEPTEPEEETEPEETTQPDTEPETNTPTTTPVGGAEPEQEPKVDVSWLLTAMEILLWVIGVVAVVLGQYGIRRKIKQRKTRKGHPNKRALAYWREATRMARLIGQMLPEKLEKLAEKARFSQHTLTAAELLEFKLWLEQAEGALREKPWIVRLAIKLIWAVA